MKTKSIWLIANWKMHGNRAAVQAFSHEINASLAAMPSHLRVVFCPPSIYLDAAHAALPQNAQLGLGAQDCHASLAGAFTGDHSASMIKEAGAGFVIVGHSERRAQYGESDALIAEKIRTAQAAGLTPVFCVGESLQAYQAGQTAYVLAAQLASFASVGAADMLIAYEPIWAIGTGKTPSAKEIHAAHTTIKSILGSDTTILYGGSVKPANIAEIVAIDSVSGALIGGASMQIADMRMMMQAVL